MQGYQVQTVLIGVLVDLFKPFNLIGLPYEHDQGRSDGRGQRIWSLLGE